MNDMATIEEAQQAILDEFDGLDDWMDRYSVIIDMGNNLAPLPEELRTPDRLIEGCQSRVWLEAKKEDDGTITLRADSDAVIVKGIIAMLVDVLSGHTPDEILNADLHFIHDVGLDEHLSPTRSNGLVAMLRQIKAYALAFKSQKG